MGSDSSSLPFEDPTVVVRASGHAIWSALENAVSLYPALEGRFPQVSGIMFCFDPSMPPFRRVKSLCIGDSPIDLDRMYTLATRDYMLRGKDGYASLVADNVEVVVGAEEGDQIYKIVLEALSQHQACENTYPRIQECSSDDHLRMAALELNAVGSALSVPCQVPMRCAVESLDVTKRVSRHRLQTWS